MYEKIKVVLNSLVLYYVRRDICFMCAAPSWLFEDLIETLKIQYQLENSPYSVFFALFFLLHFYLTRCTQDAVS